MRIVNYAPVIDDMTWSYSRIRSFYDCKYKWYLKYIRMVHGEKLFFSSYGSFVHKILEEYYKGNITNTEAVSMYLSKYMECVVPLAPNRTVAKNYFEEGFNHIANIGPIKYTPIMIEQEVSFCVDKYSFVGYVDYVGLCDGGIAIVDHKSRNLKPRKFGKKKTRSEIELEQYLMQLYIYSIPISRITGESVKSLCFNCFRSNVFIDEPFMDEELSKSKEWLVSSISEIKEESEFKPSPDYFKCTYLCDVHNECEYFQYI